MAIYLGNLVYENHSFLRKCKGREATAAAGIGPIPTGPMHSANLRKLKATFTPQVIWMKFCSDIRHARQGVTSPSASKSQGAMFAESLQLCICIALHESCDAETFPGKSGVRFNNTLCGPFSCVMVCIVIGTLNS